MSDLQVPALLDFPDKLIPIITDFNKFTFFEIEGGRISAKSHSVGRLLLYLGDYKENLRIFCGRETQESIEESVYALMVGLIKKYNLPYDIQSTKIDHKYNGTMIRFRGFREHGIVNTKGLEDVDILWVDEAQQLTKDTIDTIIPTIIRKQNARLFFTLNRTVKDDPIHVDMRGRDNCLHIHIDYFENKHCSESARKEAENCKARNIEDYRHIWLGQPRESSDNAAFRNVSYIVDKNIPVEFDPIPGCPYVLGVDLAKSVDYTVLTIFNCRYKRVDYWERMENENRSSWNYQKNKIKAVSTRYNNALTVVDSTGVGDPIVEDLIRMNVNVWFEQKDGSNKETAGMKLTSISKENIIEKLKIAIETRLIIIPDLKILVDELIDYRAIKMPSGATRYSAPDTVDSDGNKKHDDSVISLALAVWGASDAMYNPQYEEPKEITPIDEFWSKIKKDIKSVDSNSNGINITDEEGIQILDD